MLMQLNLEAERKVDDEQSLALLEAIKAGNLDRAEEMVELGADVDFVVYGEAGAVVNTPLMAAVAKKNVELLKWVLSHKPTLERENSNGFTALKNGIFYSRDLMIVQTLLEAGANPNRLNKDGQSPFSSFLEEANFSVFAADEPACSFESSKPIIELLLEYGGDIKKAKVMINDDLQRDNNANKTRCVQQAINYAEEKWNAMRLGPMVRGQCAFRCLEEFGAPEVVLKDNIVGIALFLEPKEKAPAPGGPLSHFLIGYGLEKKTNPSQRSSGSSP